MRLTGGLTFSHRHRDGNAPGFWGICSFVLMLVKGYHNWLFANNCLPIDITPLLMAYVF
jgi:hypothetical protein